MQEYGSAAKRGKSPETLNLSERAKSGSVDAWRGTKQDGGHQRILIDACGWLMDFSEM